MRVTIQNISPMRTNHIRWRYTIVYKYEYSLHFTGCGPFSLFRKYSNKNFQQCQRACLFDSIASNCNCSHPLYMDNKIMGDDLHICNMKNGGKLFIISKIGKKYTKLLLINYLKCIYCLFYCKIFFLFFTQKQIQIVQPR